MLNPIQKCVVALCLLIALAGCKRRGSSEASRVRLTTQYGLSYLPLAVMQDRHLIEKHADAAGLKGLTVEWTTLGNGSASSDALLSDSADFCAVGVAQLATLWDKTAGDVRGIAAICASPLFLNSVNPAVHDVKDFTDTDRIALPAAKVSIQAVILEMAAAKAFGDSNYAKLDKLTMPMKHPDGMAALLSGRSELTAHFTSSPFQEAELKDPRVHRVLNSYDVIGGPHTHIVLMATKAFHDTDPKVCAAVLAAIEEADASIKQDPKAAVASYLRVSRTNESPEDVAAELRASGLEFTTAPAKIKTITDFLHHIGTMKTAPASWKELFFPETQDRAGS